MFGLPPQRDRCLGEKRSATGCAPHRSGWREGHYQRMKPTLSRRDWWIIRWERKLLWETGGGERSLRCEAIMMQLACEPRRILGKAPLCPVAEITWRLFSAGQVNGSGCRNVPRIGEWLHRPLSLRCLQPIHQPVCHWRVNVCVTHLLAGTRMFGILWKTQQTHRRTLCACIDFLGNRCQSS